MRPVFFWKQVLIVFSFQEIQRLQDILKEKDQELEMIRHRPEQEKEREIQQLRSTLADKDRVQATRAVLCNSLAEEAEQLRAQLGATVQVCQELLGRLEKEKSNDTAPDHRAQVNEVCKGHSQRTYPIYAMKATFQVAAHLA